MTFERQKSSTEAELYAQIIKTLDMAFSLMGDKKHNPEG